MKKVLTIVGVVLALILLLAGVFAFRYHDMTKTLSGYKIAGIDLSEIRDGVYSGKYSKFLVSVDLQVTVKDHIISDINIISQDCGPGYDGRQVLDRVIKAQSLKVDAVTGATGSSKCILIAIDKALSGNNVK